ncbi:MAG: TlpA disulfide reductase family protein [Planctomycetota bacterium]
MRSSLIGLVVAAMVGGPLVAQTVSDEAVDAVVEKFNETRKRRLDGLPDPAVAPAIGDLPVEDLTAAQFVELCEAGLPMVAESELRERFQSVAERHSSGSNIEAVEIAVHMIRMVPWPGREAPEAEQAEFRRKRLEATVRAFEHEMLPAAFREGRATAICREIYFVRDNAVMAERGAFARLSPLITKSWPGSAVRDLGLFFRCASDEVSGVDAEELERIRLILVETFDRALENEELPDFERGYLTKQRRHADGAAAKGQLIDHAAPAMNVSWSYPEGSASSVDALQGKIVVIDFWATWCGPCVAAFPHLRDLVERYRDLPVEFVGVTSLQGWIHDPTNREQGSGRRDLSAEEELERMTPWCERMDVTWTVWMTEEDCFNPDYAVEGIPHVAVIGADGKVHHNGLHPSGTAVEDTIDAMLKVMGLEPPARQDGSESEHGGGDHR